MPDWFDSRFQEPVRSDGPDPAFVARVRELVVEEWQRDEGQTPSPRIDPDQHEGGSIMLETKDDSTSVDSTASGRGSRRPWLLGAAAVAVLAVGGGVLIANSDDDADEIDVADTAPAPPAGGPAPLDVMSIDGELEPGGYFVDPDGDPATPMTVRFTVAGEGWTSWFGAAKFGEATVSITTVTNLVTDGCLSATPADPPVGPSVDDLVAALTRLSPFEVAEAPSPVTVDGYRGTHLALRVPSDVARSGDEFSDCEDGRLHSWISPLNGDGPDDPDGGVFSGYNGDDVEELWILDVDGTRLVVQMWASPTTTADEIAEMEAIVESIRIEP